MTIEEMEKSAQHCVDTEERDLRDIAECRRIEAINTLTGAARGATEAAALFARFVLLAIPVLRVAMESTDNIPQRNRAERLGDAQRHRVADAVDTMRAALTNDPPAAVERAGRERR